jgi:hypothetical protein
VKIDVEDKTNPADTHLGDSFGIRDEIYVLDENPRWNSHVLTSLDMPSVGVTTGHADATRDDYPISWIRTYGQGHVFVTKLGHFPDVWRNPAFLQQLVTGIREAAGRTPADFGGHRVKETIAKNVWPDDIVADEEGNVWIAELTGRLLRYDGKTKQTTEVADIPTTDPTNIEHGLFGVEIDPNFYKGEPYVYVYRALRESFVNTLSRFTYRDGKLDMSTEKVLLRVPTEPSCCHQSGDLEWGEDGTLFISTGDTGQRACGRRTRSARRGSRPSRRRTPSRATTGLASRIRSAPRRTCRRCAGRCCASTRTAPSRRTIRSTGSRACGGRSGRTGSATRTASSGTTRRSGSSSGSSGRTRM